MEDEGFCKTGFPHTRLSREHAQDFARRLHDLVYEFATLPPDLEGQVYGLCTAFFLAPPYLQSPGPSSATPSERDKEMHE